MANPFIKLFKLCLLIREFAKFVFQSSHQSCITKARGVAGWITALTCQMQNKPMNSINKICLLYVVSWYVCVEQIKRSAVCGGLDMLTRVSIFLLLRGKWNTGQHGIAMFKLSRPNRRQAARKRFALIHTPMQSQLTETTPVILHSLHQGKHPLGTLSAKPQLTTKA